MATYVTQNDAGEITAQADWKFQDSVQVDYDVVRGWDGKLYKAGAIPARPRDSVFEVLRASRDVRLADTDKYLLADYPISEGDLALVKTYRDALRALPEQSGAPWDGGGSETPWPEKPIIKPIDN